MGNKLRSVFNKKEQFIRGTVRFKDVEASRDFRKALETVYKEGKAVHVDGVESVALGVESGAGMFPLQKMENLMNFVVGPVPDEVILKLEVDGEQIDFPVLRYSSGPVCKIQTKVNFPFSTTLILDENTKTTKVNFRPTLDKAENVATVLRSIKIEKSFLDKFISVDLENETGLDAVIEHLDGLYKLYEKLKYVEEGFKKKFVPGKIDLDNIESIKDLIELCLLLREKKVLRANVRLTDTTGNRLQIATDEEVVVGKEIALTFIWGLEYSLWNEKVELYCANLLNNAIVMAIDNLENGQSRIVYGEKENQPMYITYRGFISQSEAERELARIMDIKEEYENAKTVEQYIAEEY